MPLCNSLMSPAFRRPIACIILTIFILFFVVSGFKSHIPTTLTSDFRTSGFPDFSKYVDLVNLSQDEFPIEDEGKRVILVGDIHGRYDDLQRLLQKVSYNPPSDVVVSVGDIVAKGPHIGSMQVLRFMTSNNITAVRGNHDQKVIEWRAWLQWIYSMDGGERWLRFTNEKWLAYKGRENMDVNKWVSKQAKHDRTNRKWWEKIPKGWQLFGDHYQIASEMSDEEYRYMVSRPLRIHIPSAHTFVVHAGILSSDPKRDPWDERQPLATLPTLPKINEASSDESSIIRRLQELAILQKVPQNLDPWVTLNMRGVKKGGEITRDREGTPWAELYNEDMNRCRGFSSETFRQKKTSLPCRPASVVYGHAAARGLDIKRWTLGIDSGCVYKRRLTALVLGGKYSSYSFDDEDDENDDDENDDDENEDEDVEGNRAKSKVKFGDKGKGKLFSVSCH